MTAGGDRQRSAAEWVTLSLSLIVIGALIVVALVEESRRDDGGEIGVLVTFDTDRAVASGDSYYVPYTVRNTGSNAISSAEIWLEVYDQEELAESAEVLVQFLPLQGTQEGVFVTRHDPATHTLMGRLESIQFP